VHDHGPKGTHPHNLPADTDQRPLVAALGLIGVFIVVEVVVAILAHSLALLSDAAHMLTDVAALGVSLVALRLAQRPPKGGLTFGLKRAEALAALISGATLLVFEAVIVCATEPRLHGGALSASALAGIVVTLAVPRQLSHADCRILNIEAS